MAGDDGSADGGEHTSGASSEAADGEEAGSDRAGETGGSEQSSQKIRRLHEVATAMQTAGSVSEIYDLTVEASVDILGFDWSLFEIATDGYFEVVAVSERAPVDVGDRPITTDHGVTGKAYRTGESDILHDARDSAEAEPTLETFRSGLTVPMGERGVFQGISEETGFFDEVDLELVELLITHTTAALDRIEETQRLNELNDATRRLMAAETHASVAAEASEIASSVLDAPLTIIFYYDGTDETLVPMAATDTAREVLGGAESIQESDEPPWSAFDEGSTVREVGEGDWQYLHVPLGEQGVLCVGSSVQGAFGDDDVALAETLAANIESAFTRADREQRRREQATQLQRQNDRLDRFASIVSHDLRNPLHIAATRAALAREEHDSEHLRHIEDALDRMETIIEDTLSLARQGKTVEETEPVSLSRVAAQSWAQVETDGSNLEIVSDGTVQADPDRLQHVFENLFHNSVAHGADGSGGVSVRLETLPDGFSVADTGVGVPESERDQIFELGYSGDADGTGFGLAIVEEIVESHGWEVAVTGSAADGARFEITGVDIG